MELGTWGEWVGALATTAATVTALWLGLRDGDRTLERRQARTSLRATAKARASKLREVANGYGGDGRRELNLNYSKDDVEASELVSYANELGWLRRARARRLIGKIFSPAVIAMVEADPSHTGGDGDVLKAAMREGSMTFTAVNEGVEERRLIDTTLHQALVEPHRPDAIRSVAEIYDRLARV